MVVQIRLYLQAKVSQAVCHYKKKALQKRCILCFPKKG